MLPYHTIPYHTIPYHTIPYHTIPYHTIPYHTIPYHTIPYHTIPYHTIPYHTITPSQTHDSTYHARRFTNVKTHYCPPPLSNLGYQTWRPEEEGGARVGHRPHLENPNPNPNLFAIFWGPFCYFFSIWGLFATFFSL